jgi:hypothetical protein
VRCEMAAQKHPMPQFMNTKRLSTGPLSQRQIASKFGISRSAQWRAKKIADIPEEEFEALIESDNPPTVTTLAEYAHGHAPQASGLRRLIKEWTRASEQDQVAFLEWVSGARLRTSMQKQKSAQKITPL